MKKDIMSKKKDENICFLNNLW